MKHLWKKIVSMVLIAALLVQVLPATAKGAELLPDEFEPQTGLSDMYEYLTYDVGKAGTLNINTYKDEMHIRRTDISLGGERLPVDIEFYYDPVNYSYAAKPYGHGWVTSYNQLIIYDNEKERYQYTDENGTRIYFSEVSYETEDGYEVWKADTFIDLVEKEILLYRTNDASMTQYSTIKIMRDNQIYIFDSYGRLIRITDGTNDIRIVYVSPSSLAISYISDAIGRRYVFQYANGILRGVYATINGNRIPNTQVTYNIESGKLLSVCYGNEDLVTYSYDSRSRLTSLTNVDACGYQIVYSVGNNLFRLIQKAGMGTEEEENGQITNISYSAKSKSVFTTKEDRKTYFLDGWGDILSYKLERKLEDGTYETVYGYYNIYDNVTGRLVDVVYYDANGVIEETQTTEDNVITEESSEIETEVFEEESIDNYVTIEDEYGNILMEINSLNELRQMSNYSYIYNGSYLSEVTDVNGSTQKYSYPYPIDKPESIIDGNGNQTSYTYNALWELSSVKMNVSGLKTLGSDLTLINDGTSINVNYEYEKGRLTTICYGDCIYHFTYDKWGNLLSVSMDGKTLVSYDYGEEAYKGWVRIITYGNGQSLYYTYNFQGQVIGIGSAENAPYFKYSYGSDGNLESIWDIAFQRVTQFTDNGYKIYRGTLSNCREVLYEYQGTEDNYVESVLGKILEYRMENDETVSWLQVLDDSGVEIYSEKVIFDGFNRVQEKQLSVGTWDVTNKYRYNIENGLTGNRINDYQIEYLLGSENQNLQFCYSYDGNGNIVSAEGSEQGIMTSDWTYVYDEAGQLTEAYEANSGIGYRYAYDKQGIVVCKEEYVVSDDGDETLVERVLLNYEGMILKNSYSTVTGETLYNHDDMGNMIGFQGKSGMSTLKWSEGRSLYQILNSRYNAQYTYNDEGLRIIREVKEFGKSTYVEYVWGNHGLAGFTMGEDTVVVLYGQDGTPIGFSLNDTVYTYIKNLQGDVIRVLDTEGNTVVEYSYDPWGVPTITGDTVLAAINPCSYRCYDYDEESGFYYLQSRYYNPQTGRFLNADDISVLQIASEKIELYNLFVYCGNNPIDDSDPSGYLSINGVMDIIKSAFKNINSSINKYFKSLFVYNAYKKILSISTDVVSTTIDTIIAILIKQVVYKAVQAGLKMLLKNQTIRKAFVKQTFDFFINNGLGRIVLSGIISVGLSIVGIKGSVRTVADSLVSNLISNIIVNKWKILQAPVSIINAFSSIGGVTAFFFDLMDGKWDDYVSIKIIY